MRVKFTVSEEEIRKLIAALLEDKSGARVDPCEIRLAHTDVDGPIEATVDVDASSLHPVPN